MDTTQTKRPTRSIHIFCEIDRHEYCSRDRVRDGFCECSCHFDTKISYSKHLGEMAYAFFELERSLKDTPLSQNERQERYLMLIEAADGTVDFEGRSAEGVLAALEGTLQRAREGYWSMGQTLEDFGMPGRY